MFKKVRDFVRCCKKTTIEMDSMLEDLNRIHLENQPKPRKENDNKDDEVDERSSSSILRK